MTHALTTADLRAIAQRGAHRIPGDRAEQHAQSRRDVLRLVEEVVRLWAEAKKEEEMSV